MSGVTVLVDRRRGNGRGNGCRCRLSVDHDGQRFLMVEQAPADEQQVGADRRINLIVNWFTELERLAPTP